MARFGTVISGSFVGAVGGAIWTEIHDVLIPLMLTYSNGTSVRVPFDAPKWEGHILSQNHAHLRIDFQGVTEPRTTDLVTWQTGSRSNREDASPIRYGNWQVQYGPHGKKRGSFNAKRTLTGADLQNSKGSIAGIHMALANDFTIADIQRAFQLSYDGCQRTGSLFGVLLPAGAYTEPIVEVEKRWILDIICKRTCKTRNRLSFKVNFGKKEGRWAEKQEVKNWLDNALSHIACPVCASQYALEFDGTNYLVDQAVTGRANWAYNLDIDSHTLTARV